MDQTLEHLFKEKARLLTTYDCRTVEELLEKLEKILENLRSKQN